MEGRRLHKRRGLIGNEHTLKILKDQSHQGPRVSLKHLKKSQGSWCVQQGNPRSTSSHAHISSCCTPLLPTPCHVPLPVATTHTIIPVLMSARSAPLLACTCTFGLRTAPMHNARINPHTRTCTSPTSTPTPTPAYPQVHGCLLLPPSYPCNVLTPKGCPHRHLNLRTMFSLFV